MISLAGCQSTNTNTDTASGSSSPSALTGKSIVVDYAYWTIEWNPIANWAFGRNLHRETLSIYRHSNNKTYFFASDKGGVVLEPGKRSGAQQFNDGLTMEYSYSGNLADRSTVTIDGRYAGRKTSNIGGRTFVMTTSRHVSLDIRVSGGTCTATARIQRKGKSDFLRYESAADRRPTTCKIVNGRVTPDE